MRLLPTILIVAALAGVAQAGESPRAIVTIDVESFTGLPLPDQVDARCEDDAPCGLMQIARMLEERGYAGTFFLNVYEHTRWGDAAMREITRRLMNGGHEVALHTHPHWAYDPDRPYMYEYSLDEQTRIVADGKRLLEDWTGAAPLTHRAGAYSADANTLEALARNGIALDSSLFFRHPHSRLNGLGLPNNFPSRRHGVIQIPVNAYYREDRPALAPGLFPPVATVRKLDPDWLTSRREARMAMDAMIESGSPYLILFLHSYTLIDGLNTPAAPDGRFRMDRHAYGLFNELLDYIDHNAIEVVTLREVAAGPVATDSTEERIPGVSVTVAPHRYAVRWLRSNGNAAMFIAFGAGVFGLGGISALIVARRRRNRPS